MCSLWYFYCDTIPFVCLLDGDVHVLLRERRLLSSFLERLGYVGGMGRVESLIVRVMYCSSLGLEDKGGVQSNLPLNGCLGGSAWLILE